MTIEILDDPQELARLNELTLDGERHEICADGDWIRWARRIGKRPGLFIYHHKEEGTWVLADWVYPPGVTDKPVCTELMVLQGPPDDIQEGRPDELFLWARCQGVRTERERARRDRREARWAHAKAEEDRLDAKADNVNWLRKQGLEHSAWKVENTAGWKPAAQTTVDEFMGMAHSKTYGYAGAPGT